MMRSCQLWAASHPLNCCSDALHQTLSALSRIGRCVLVCAAQALSALSRIGRSVLFCVSRLSKSCKAISRRIQKPEPTPDMPRHAARAIPAPEGVPDAVPQANVVLPEPQQMPEAEAVVEPQANEGDPGAGGVILEAEAGAGEEGEAPIQGDNGAGGAAIAAAAAVAVNAAAVPAAAAALAAAAAPVVADPEAALQADKAILQLRVAALEQELADGVVAAAAEAGRVQNEAAAALTTEPLTPKIDAALQRLFDTYDDVWKADIEALLAALGAHAGVSVLNLKTMMDAGGSRADIAAPLLKDYAGTPDANGAAVDFVGELAELSPMLRARLENADAMHRTVRLVRALQEAAAHARMQLPTAGLGVALEAGAGGAGEDELATSVLDNKCRIVRAMYHDEVKLHLLARAPQLKYINVHFQSKTSFPHSTHKLRLGLLHAYEELLGAGVGPVEESTLHMDSTGAVVVTGFGPKETILKTSVDAAARFQRLLYSVFVMGVDKTVDAKLYDIGLGYQIAGEEMLVHKTPILGLAELFTSAAPKLTLEVMVTAITDCHRGLVDNTTGERAMTISRACAVAQSAVRTNLNYLCHLVSLGHGRSSASALTQVHPEPEQPFHVYSDASLSGHGTFVAELRAERYIDDTLYSWVVTELNPADALSGRNFLPEAARALSPSASPTGRWR